MRPRRCCASCTSSGAAALRAIRSRRACERMARASSPITSASIHSPSVFVCVPPDLYMRLGRERGWGSREEWTHFDGYQLLGGGGLRALASA